MATVVCVCVCVSHLTVYKHGIQHAVLLCANFGSYVVWGTFLITQLFLNGQHLCSQILPPASAPVYKRSDPCSNAMYVRHVCKQTDLNVQHIQNLPWLKIHTLIYCKQVTATCFCLQISHCRGITPVAKGVGSFFVLLKTLAHWHSCFSSFDWEGHTGQAIWQFLM